MKTSNRKMLPSARLAAALAAGLLAASGLAMGSAAAESRPAPVPHQGTLFAGVQAQTPQITRLARTGDTAAPWQIDPRKDGRHVAPHQPQELHTAVTRQQPPFGPQGPWYR